MKRFVHSLVLICLLGSNIAWAWDSHAEILTGHVSDTSGLIELNESANENASENPNKNLDADDPGQHDHYCCCGAAHIVALALSMPAITVCQADKADVDYRSTLINHIPILPSKPPRT